MPLSFRHLVQTTSTVLGERNRQAQARAAQAASAERQAEQDRRGLERHKSILARRLQETAQGRASMEHQQRSGERAERALAETALHHRALERRPRGGGRSTRDTTLDELHRGLTETRQQLTTELGSVIGIDDERVAALRRRITEFERRIDEHTGFAVPGAPLPVAPPLRVPPPAGGARQNAPTPRAPAQNPSIRANVTESGRVTDTDALGDPGAASVLRESLIGDALRAGLSREEAEAQVEAFLRSKR